MILGLDISTGTRANPIGYALFKGREYFHSGEKTFDGNADQRILAFYDWLDNLLTRSARDLSPITDVVVETPAGDHANRRTDRQLGGVFYAALCLAHRHGAAFHRVSPAAVQNSGVSKHNLLAAEAWIRDAAGQPDFQVSKDQADAVGAVLTLLERERIYSTAAVSTAFLEER